MKTFKAIKRCTKCIRKMGSIYMECSCGDWYCLRHLPRSEHDCPNGKLKDHQEIIRRNNPQVLPEKHHKL